MVQKIQGAQRDFSYGEIDVALKRADDHPARKAGLRQMSNARILNSGGLQDRPGRRALFLETGRIEEVLMSPGNVFYLAFGIGYLRVYNAAGTRVFATTVKGDGTTPISWTKPFLQQICWVIGPGPQLYSIYITYADGTTTNVPQVLTWDSVSQTSTWTLTTYAENVTAGGQKWTPFFRISPTNITMLPNGHTQGVAITITFSAPVLVAGMVGTRMRYVNKQLLITAVASSTVGTAVVEETLPLGELLHFSSDPAVIFGVGQEVIGAASGALGIVTAIDSPDMNMSVQTLANSSGSAVQFVAAESVSGPGGALIVTGFAATEPLAVSVWDDEVMNAFRGYPTGCFVDQNRLGFNNFPSVRNGICWSAISTPTNLFTGPNPDDSIFEIAPNKAQVFSVVPGPEGSEFVFTDIGLWYIPISVTNPLIPGSVAFNLLSRDGAAPVQPRLAQEAILYVNAGQNSIMAVIATGAYNRPFNTKNLSDFHNHLFNNVQCIAAPSADGTFTERYAYALNGDGSIAVGKYQPDSLQGNQPVIGWGPWSGGGVVSWIAARAADVIFTSSYFGAGVCEVLDDTQYLDCALPVNAAPAAFAPPVGKGPLWFIPGQSVTLMDQVTRAMGVYQIDANGFIVPQFNGGENLAIASLVAGQPWTMTVEPFAPDAQPGSDMGQRMNLRQISRIAIYVINSTGFMFASLFSAKQTKTSPPLGTIQLNRRVPAWNMGDDATKPPTLRETVEDWSPVGSSYDPRVAIIKDSPGPLQILEFSMEVSI